MDWRLFFSTFALIFLAELGDKTQLASMAASAGTKSPISVFAGAASALVASTLVAVIAGSLLQKYVPEHYIKGVAAILFLFFGVLLAINAFHLRKEYKVNKAAPAPTGIFAKVAFRAAAEFERGAAEDYRKLAAKADTAALKSLFTHLADEEQSHLERVLHISDKHPPEEHLKTEHAIPESTIPTAQQQADTNKIIDSAIQHEKSTAGFYRALSQAAVIAEVKKAFAVLAFEEESHVAHLEEFKRTGETDVNQKHA